MLTLIGAAPKPLSVPDVCDPASFWPLTSEQTVALDLIAVTTPFPWLWRIQIFGDYDRISYTGSNTAPILPHSTPISFPHSTHATTISTLNSGMCSAVQLLALLPRAHTHTHTPHETRRRWPSMIRLYPHSTPRGFILLDASPGCLRPEELEHLKAEAGLASEVSHQLRSSQQARSVGSWRAFGFILCIAVAIFGSVQVRTLKCRAR